IPSQLLNALRQYIGDGRPLSEATYLFLRHGRRTGQPVSRTLVKLAMRRAYHRCGFPKDWGGTHRLRHTFASRLYAHGEHPKVVADFLGHRHLDTTNDYLHVDLKALRSLAQPWPLRS